VRPVPEMDQHEVIRQPHCILDRSKAVRITIAQIELMRVKLAALPPAPVVPTQAATKMDAVVALAPELVALRGKGWGFQALAAFMTEGGFAISPGTLKNYLQRAGATRTKRRRKKASTSSVATGTSVPSAPPAASSSVAPKTSPLAECAVVPSRATSYGSFVVRADTEL
jgi:hypothetical protein